MKLIIDLDPKLLRRLEVVSNSRGQTVSDVIAELLNKILSRDSTANSSSAEGLPSPAMIDAAKKAAAPAPTAAPAVAAAPAAAPVPAIAAPTTAPAAASTPGTKAVAPSLEAVVMLIAHLRVADTNGSQRRALLSELQLLAEDQVAKHLSTLLKQSLS